VTTIRKNSPTLPQWCNQRHRDGIHLPKPELDLPRLTIPFNFGLLLVIIVCPIAVFGQESLPETPQPQVQADQTKSGPRKHGHNQIFWIFPNYRSADQSGNITPLTPREKLKLAFDDSFSPSAFLVAGISAGLGMARDQYPSLGQGAQGFGKYYGTSFANQAIGNYMTEALFPIAQHQDPRYFVKGKGGFWTRVKYAVSREVITRGDDGRSHFNTSEIVGNAVAAGISNAYYPAEERTAGKTTAKWAQQIGSDAGANVLKEFWPDIHRKFFAH